MNALTILARCRSAETDKRRIRQQIERRREAITCISPRMDANGGGRSTAEQDKIGAFVAAVTELEQRLKQLGEELAKPEKASDMALVNEYTETQKQLDDEVERWEQLSEELERING